MTSPDLQARLARARQALADFAMSGKRNEYWMNNCAPLTAHLNAIADRRDWHAVTNERAT